MRLDGYGLFVKDMAAMIRFYRDVLGFEIKEDESTDSVFYGENKNVLSFPKRKNTEAYRVCVMDGTGNQIKRG